MARTRATVAAKVSSGKSSKARCCAAPPPSAGSSARASSDKSSKSNSGGNPVCPRETPKWQKPITNFFIQNQITNNDNEPEEEAKAGSSKSKPKRNVIQSDDEEEEQIEKPKNKELDETIELEPLSGEDSHKIDEYYSTKDKGKGKKSNKENIDDNIKRNKRHLEELNMTEESERSGKKMKVV